VSGETNSPLGKCLVEEGRFLKEGDNLSPPFVLPFEAAEERNGEQPMTRHDDLD
jgi:hypothetical protein